MTIDWKAAQAATHPFQRRREALAQEHAVHTAAAQAATPPKPYSPPPFITNPLRTCVCGARPRYGFEEHVARCQAAQMAVPVAAEVPVVDPVSAHEAPAVEVAATDVTCPKCGKAMKRRGAHFHIAKCRG